jgi:hypothetical protein
MQRIGFIPFTRLSADERRRARRLQLANMEMGEPIYDVHLLSETGRSIRSSIGISAATGRSTIRISTR